MGFGTIFAFSARFRPAWLRSDDYWSQVSRWKLKTQREDGNNITVAESRVRRALIRLRDNISF